jgi:SulP family sulfate permease
MHSVFILLFMLVAAPLARFVPLAALARFVPLAALAGLLVVVSWNMAEKAEFLNLVKHWRSGAVLLATFALTLVRDLSTGIAAGCLLAALFALSDRMNGKAA